MPSADDLLSRVLPQFFPAHWLEKPGIAFSPFPSRVRVGYVLRAEGGYGYVMEDELAELRLTVSAVHAAALDNLARLPGARLSIADVPGGAEGWVSASEDNFAAARILLPSVQRRFRDALGDDFLFAIACRDDCFCWSRVQSPERQEQHAREAMKTFLQDDYNLTPDVLFCGRRDGFLLHREQPIGGTAVP